jgi:FHS family L-fucose permease-like MFS transporter
MALAPSSSAPAAASPGTDTPADLRWFVFVLFFVFGGITSLNDVLIPKLKELFTLNYTQAMLVQFCFFTAYLVVGIPGARLVKRLGYMRGAVAGLVIMLVGCLLFIPAAQAPSTACSCWPCSCWQAAWCWSGGRQSAHLAAGNAADGA